IARVHAFLSEFVATGAFRSVSPDTLMFRPYGRVVVLHLVLLLGGFIAQELASRVAPLVILALIKIAIDLAPRLRGQAPQYPGAYQVEFVAVDRPQVADFDL